MLLNAGVDFAAFGGSYRCEKITMVWMAVVLIIMIGKLSPAF